MSTNNKTSNPLPRTKPINSADPHNDLRVIWDATGTRIISDHPKYYRTKHVMAQVREWPALTHYHRRRY